MLKEFVEHVGIDIGFTYTISLETPLEPCESREIPVDASFSMLTDIERPYHPSLFLFEADDFSTKSCSLRFVFHDNSISLPISTSPFHFGTLLTHTLSPHTEKQITAVRLVNESNSRIETNAMLVFAKRAIHEERLNAFCTTMMNRVKYATPKDYMHNSLLQSDDMEECISMEERNSLVDSASLQHFKDIPNVILFTCCQTLYAQKYFFTSFARHRIKSMKFPFACPTCNYIAHDPVQHIRKVPRRMMEGAIDKNTYRVQNGGIDFFA